MRLLALIPARGGSKRLPGKNVRPLAGKPLIAWTIDLAKQLGPSVDVLVSTDDQDIAQVAHDFGAPVPWLRPAELSDDTASSVDVAIHALDMDEASHGKVDGLILLQPTSPFRRLQTAQDGIDLFLSNGQTAVVAVSAAKSHPEWCFTVAGREMKPYCGGQGTSQRSQDLQPVFELNGALYIISPEQLRRERSFFPKGCLPLICSNDIECIDIDTEWDWLCAEKAVESGLVHLAEASS